MIVGAAHICLRSGIIQRVFSSEDKARAFWNAYYDPFNSKRGCGITDGILYIDGVPHEASIPFVIDPEIYD